MNMNQRRYGEAIDLLNKYITENPQNSEGYFLRATCYKARGQYEFAVYDFRSASKLNKDDLKLAKSLSRVTQVWYTQLYNKIEGHQREIALYPNKARNYLEIGKCYKNLGSWSEAEEWYDKYLSMEEPSADEVIRYSEILAKNGHLTKGEIILKKFVEKYPDDHRLWSRYGYFTYWLGKNKIAVMAFTEALHFRPFFKEAIDGLNLAQGKGSIYTVNDTSYRYNKFTGTLQKPGKQDSKIDRYFRMLKLNASNDTIRINLIKELIKVNRLEEAKQQFALLNENNVDAFTIAALDKEITDKWNEYHVNKIYQLNEKVKLNPADRKAVQELANHYSLVNKIDSVDYICSNYLSKNPSDDEIRFDLAKKLSWFKEFEKAREHADILLSHNPNKTEYQLLRAQISIWTSEDSEFANSLLYKVLEKEPNNIQALISSATLKYQTQQFTSAEAIINQIEKIDPANADTKELKYNLVIQKKQYEEAEQFKLLQQARNSLNEKKCADAVNLFKEYLSKAESNEKVKLELANAYVCSNDYPNAINIYSKFLNEKYDYELAKQRAKLYFWSGDSLNALKEFKSLNSQNKEDAEVKLYLGDSYFQMKDYQNAKKLYSELSAQSPSSKLIETRLSWLYQDSDVDGSFSSFINNFPSYTLITPEVNYFKDNLSFKYDLLGLRAEIGAAKYLSIGGSIYRGNVSSDSSKLNFYTYLGSLVIFPTKLLTASFSFGQTEYQDNRKQNISEVTLKSEVADRYSLIGRYRLSDAAQTLYSPFLIDTSLNVTEYSFEGSYFTPSQIILSAQYSYSKISDGNNGKELILRIGKKFSSEFVAGYEYNNLDYDFETPLYYSPNNFESHSLWADYNIIRDEVIDFFIGGKVGLVPNNDFLVKEFNSKLSLKLFESFTLQGQLVFSENSREEVIYRSTSIYVSAFWLF
jgi:tetratricopeptide (TPR) repeat protein